MIFGMSLPCLALVGCTGEPEAIGTSEPATQQVGATRPEPAESTIQWTGRGQEPFWTLRIRGLETELRQPGAGYATTADEIQVKEAADGTTIAKFIRNGAPYLSVTRNDEVCIDPSTGAPFPYSMRVQSGEQAFIGCGGSTEEYLANGEWVVEDIDGHGVVDGGEPRIEFRNDGTVILNAICRKIAGKYAVHGPEVTFEFEPVASEGCKVAALKRQEDRLLNTTSDRLTLGVNTSRALSLGHGDRARLTLQR